MRNSKIIITIDTEVGERAKYVKDGFEKFVMGEIGHTYYGIPKIVEILDEYGFKGEFFIDVYEYIFFGEEKYEKLCTYLHEKGHGIQLHTHPSYAYDINRINMHEYSLEEQIRIVAEGKELIKRWINEYPIAHRAGSYGADNNTLIALKENNIIIDSSFFYGHQNCNIQLSTINDPIVYSNVLEIPVTIFKRGGQFFGITIPFKSSWVKLDINWLTSRDLEKGMLNLFGKYEYIIFFMHSSSFIIRDESLTDVVDVNTNDLEKFRTFLHFIRENSYVVANFKDINLHEYMKYQDI